MNKYKQITFKFVGPIKRSTFDLQPSDSIDEAITDLLHWSWSTRVQIDRYKKSFFDELKAFNTGTSIQRRHCSSLTSYDEHLILVAAKNLERALNKVSKYKIIDNKLNPSQQRVLTLLRNTYEHWDQSKREYRRSSDTLKRIATKLKVEYPQAEPWSASWNPETGDIILANQISLRKLISELRSLEATLLRIQRTRLNNQSSGAHDTTS